MSINQREHICIPLEKLFPPGFTAFLHDTLDFLGSCPRGNQQSIGHIDNNEIVYTQQGDETS